MYTQVRVRYNDGSEGMIDTPRLEETISFGRISHFRRSDGWVGVEGARTRAIVRGNFAVKERRRDLLARQTFFRPSSVRDVSRYNFSILSRVRQNYTVMFRTFTSLL